MESNSDIGELKKKISDLEKKLKETERNFLFLRSNIPDVIWTTDANGNTTFISDNVEKVYGFTAEEIYKGGVEVWFGRIHPEDLPKVKESYAHIFNKNENFDVEYRIQRKDGQWIWLRDRSVHFFEKQGMLYANGIFTEITKRKSAEVALKESEVKLKKLNDELEKQVNEKTTQLRISEEKFRDIVNNVIDVILEIDIKGRFLYVSPQVYNILGYTPEELINTSGYTLMHPDDIEGIKRITQEAIAKGKPIFYEYRIRHKNGRYIPMTANGNYIKIGNSGKIIGIVRDDTEKKASEQRLKESEEKYRNLIYNIRDILIEVDINRKIIYISPQSEDILGYKPEELIGKNSGELLHTDDSLLTKEEILKALKTGEPLYNEHRVKHKLGHYIYLSMRGKVLKVGENLKITGIFRDITEKVKIEEKLKESETRYRELFDHMSSCVAVYEAVDNGTNFVFKDFNQAAERLEKISKEQVIYKKVTDVFPGVKAFGLFEVFQRVWKTGKPELHPISVYTDNRLPSTYRENFVYKLPSGEIIAVYDDITEKKAAEQKIKESEERYRNAYDRELIYKDLFVHDFNNILQNIKSSADLTSIYLETPLNVQTTNELNEIVKEQVFRGSKLIKNVRKLTQLEESKIQTSPIELYQILNEVMDYIKQTFQTKVIKFQKTTPTEEIFVFANELLSDVFENIFINAIRYCDNPVCEISVKITKCKEKENRYIKVEVIDNARGIPEELKAVIFQVGFSKEKRTKGMGFGLSVVKKIIERYNGKISVENRVKDDYTKGSNFVVLLPEAK